MKQTNYNDSIHRLGRIGILGALIVMLGIPTIICAVYNIFPSISDLLKSSVGLIALFLPVAISEVISYVPLLGSASYITFITGNLMNLKVPCVMNAFQIVGAEQNTDEGDAIATLAVATSSIITTLIIALGVALIVPLQPLLESPAVKTATAYMLPALFGCLFLSQLTSSTGTHIIKNKVLVVIAPITLILLFHFFILSIKGLEGVFILLCIPLVLISARILYKKGIVRVESNIETKP